MNWEHKIRIRKYFTQRDKECSIFDEREGKGVWGGIWVFGKVSSLHRCINMEQKRFIFEVLRLKRRTYFIYFFRGGEEGVFDERGKELHKMEQRVFYLVVERRRMVCVCDCVRSFFFFFLVFL